jgi:hypothetical protein
LKPAATVSAWVGGSGISIADLRKDEASNALASPLRLRQRRRKNATSAQMTAMPNNVAPIPPTMAPALEPPLGVVLFVAFAPTFVAGFEIVTTTVDLWVDVGRVGVGVGVVDDDDVVDVVEGKEVEKGSDGSVVCWSRVVLVLLVVLVEVVDEDEVVWGGKSQSQKSLVVEVDEPSRRPRWAIAWRR